MIERTTSLTNTALAVTAKSLHRIFADRDDPYAVGIDDPFQTLRGREVEAAPDLRRHNRLSARGDGASHGDLL